MAEAEVPVTIQGSRGAVDGLYETEQPTQQGLHLVSFLHYLHLVITRNAFYCTSISLGSIYLPQTIASWEQQRSILY